LRYDWNKQEVTEFPGARHPDLGDPDQRRTVELAGDRSNRLEPLTLTAQYMLASMQLECEPDAELILPVPDFEVYESIMRLLVPYFTETQAIHFGGKEWPCEIRLCHPRTSVTKQFQQMKQSGTLNPIVQAMFRQKPDSDAEWREVRHFEINRAVLETFDHSEFEETLDLFKKSLLKTWGQLVLNPQGWLYTDELRHNPALRFFSAHFEHSILTVQRETGKITFLTLF